MEDVGRSVDIELGGQEVITIDLDNLDPNPVDILDLLREGKCKVWVWTKIAGEYWRRGTLEAADQIARTAIESERYHTQVFNRLLIHCISLCSIYCERTSFYALTRLLAPCEYSTDACTASTKTDHEGCAYVLNR